MEMGLSTYYRYRKKIEDIEFGSANGMQENWVCIILLTIHGKNGNCRGIVHNLMLKYVG